jgi:hypothetical protein
MMYAVPIPLIAAYPSLTSAHLILYRNQQSIRGYNDNFIELNCKCFLPNSKGLFSLTDFLMSVNSDL